MAKAAKQVAPVQEENWEDEATVRVRCTSYNRPHIAPSKALAFGQEADCAADVAERMAKRGHVEILK